MAEERLIYDIDGGRLPYSVEAEQAVLGSVIIDPKCLTDIATSMKTEYFYIPQHREIYAAMASMYELSQSIDFVSLLEKLKTDGVYDEAGGKAYLTELVQRVPSSANVLTYVAIIRERYYARALMTAAQGIIKDINDNELDSGKLLDSAEQRIYEIRQGRDITGLTHIKSVIENETYDRLSKMNDPETRDDYIGIPCGIGELDRMITGLNKSDLIILGARPGMGKTSFALNIVRNVAVNTGKTVCFFSLEMTRDQLAQRMLSSEAGINRVQEISEITRNLKIMAKDLKVPIIACAQLSRGTEGKGKSHRPALSDLRDSGSIEQDADIVLFLYRDAYYDNEKSDDEDRSDQSRAECIVAKNRHGEIGTVDLHWDGQYTRFTSVDVYR